MSTEKTMGNHKLILPKLIMIKIYLVTISINTVELRKKLMNFFESSDHFDPISIIELMPPSYLLKERVFLLAKSRKYKEAFGICVEQI